MQTLDVINEMLGTMGQAPLNTLDDPHPMRGACLSTLAKNSRNVQAVGWWFNRESLTITPSVLDSGLYLPGDVISVFVPHDKNTGEVLANVVQRGRRLYDTEKGSYVFTSAVTVELRRLLEFEDLPEVAAAYIAARAVKEFQLKYDGDSQKTRDLDDFIKDPVIGAYSALNAEEIRQGKANFLEQNQRLQRLKLTTSMARRYIR